MWKGQFDALFGLIAIIALVVAGIASNNAGDWGVFMLTFIAVIGFWIFFQTLNFLSKAFRGRPLFYDGVIEEKRKRR